MRHDPLPLLSQEARQALKEFAATDKFPYLNPGPLDELFAEGLVCDNDNDGLPCDLYVTQAGYAYLSGRRLPSIVIPDYHTGEIEASDETYYASGCDQDMLDYIAEYHSIERDSRGFPIVDVGVYFEEGAESWGNEGAEMYENMIRDSMEFGRVGGYKFVCFND